MKVIEKYSVTFVEMPFLNSECQTTCSGMLKPRQLLKYFGHNSLCFRSFQNSRQTCGSGEGGGRQGGVGHIGAGIILSASYLLGFDLFLFEVKS